MDSPSITRDQFDSTDSNDVEERPKFAVASMVVYFFCVFTTIALLVVELFVYSFHYGSVRPLWAYILGACLVVVIILTTLHGLSYLASVQWRPNDYQQKTNEALVVLVWSLFGILFCCFAIFPFQDQVYYSKLLIFIGGFGIGMFTVVTILVSVYLFFGQVIFQKLNTA